MRRAAALALVTGLALLAPAPAAGNERSRALTRQAFTAIYNLDYEEAEALFRQAMAADPGDAAAFRGGAASAWLRILAHRGTVTADEYLGRLKSGSVDLPPAPPDLARAFLDRIARATELGELSVARNFGSASAHYDLGAALGLTATYSGAVEGRIIASMRAARRAFSEHELALAQDPTRKDVGLVLGTYRYVVSNLPRPLRWMAYIIGFGGDRQRAFRLLEDAAADSSEVQADAHLALVLLYNRERRYDDAIGHLRTLEEAFPRNRLLLLEEGGTLLRAGRPRQAAGVLDEGIARLEKETRTLVTGERARWYYKRGLARVLLRQASGAETDLHAALADPTGATWVKGRAHTELGKVADLGGDRKRARAEYQQAIAIGEKVRDEQGVTDARLMYDIGYR